ncbi:hypothetical protein HK103_006328 [Boothiomyces macroporosus]|uniref:Uncharacterized protein n=1 Tax=Boothiomyces macroporosus TaxID=261099 RepID=A0AAD5UDS4_9FUNG|nr:hypothetical protein HK103_006328 [Boothiomyces macroporosus]
MHQFFPPNENEIVKLELQIKALESILDEYSKQEPPLLLRWRSKVYQLMVTHKFEILEKDKEINRLNELLDRCNEEKKEKNVEIQDLKNQILYKDSLVLDLNSQINQLQKDNSIKEQEAKNFEYVKQEKTLLELEVVQLQKDRKTLLNQLLNTEQPLKELEKQDACETGLVDRIKESSLTETKESGVKQEPIDKLKTDNIKDSQVKKLEKDKLEALDQLSELLLKIV